MGLFDRKRGKKQPIDAGRVALALATGGMSEVARGGADLVKDVVGTGGRDNRDAGPARRPRLPTPEDRMYPQRKHLARMQAFPGHFPHHPGFGPAGAPRPLTRRK